MALASSYAVSSVGAMLRSRADAASRIGAVHQEKKACRVGIARAATIKPRLLQGCSNGFEGALDKNPEGELESRL
jgi:hypothetical protein